MFKVKKGLSKFVGLLVALSMVIASGTYTTVSAAPIVLTDIAGHKFQTAIQSAVDSGYISGHGDGRFAPEDPITRAQFTSMVNRAFSLSKKASLDFKDMKDGSQWYYEPIQVAVGSGYMVGYDDDTFRPLNNMTWAHCITVYVNLLGYSENKAAAQNIGNYSTFQNKWYVGNVGAAYAVGIIDSNVMINGTINPDNTITRAEATYMLSLAYAIKNGGTLPGSVTELADKFVVPANAAFGPTSGVKTVTKNVSVTGAGAVLQNLDIRGNLTIESSVGDGDVYLKGVTVTGTTTILGGGPNTIRAIDTQFSTVNLNDSNSNVRLLLEGNSRATTVNASSGGTLAATGLTGTGFGTVNVIGSTSSAYPLNINANVTSLNISAFGSYVNVNSGIVGTATIAATGTNSTLNLTSSATVSSLVANTTSSVYGKVNQATLKTTGVYMSQTPGSLTAGSYSPSTTPGSSTGTLSLSPSSLSFNSSNASGVTLTATVNNTNTTAGQSVTFTSSDSSFVSLSSGSYSGQTVSVIPSGNVAYVTARMIASDAMVAANYGKTVTITASYGGYTQTSYVTIGGTGSSLITLSPSSVTFNSSNYSGVTLSATLGSSIASSGQLVTFTSSDSSLVTLTGGSYSGQSVSVVPSGNTAYVTAKLTSNALLTSHNGRSVTITATYGGYSQSMVVYINNVSGTSSLSASPSAITLSESNLSGVSLTATTNSIINSTTSMSFTIADSSLATVTSGSYTGKTVSVTPSGTTASVVVKPVGDAATIAANKGRSTTLTITYGSYTQTVPISISNVAQVADVILTSTTNTVDLNKTVTLTPTYIYSNGTKSSSFSGAVSWSVVAGTNAAISLVSNGVYKGVSSGTGIARLTVIDGTVSVFGDYAISVKDPNRVDLTAPSSITVDRIANSSGYDFNVTLKGGGEHNLFFNFEPSYYDLFYYTTYSSTGLKQITSSKDIASPAATQIITSTYGSTTMKLRLVPKNNMSTVDGSLKITGEYINTSNPPITTQYNERAINVVYTSSPSIIVDKPKIETMDNVINVTISNPAAQGTLTLKAFSGTSLVNNRVIFGNNSSATPIYSVTVTATAGTATTIPIQIRRTDTDTTPALTLSVEYSSSDNTVSAKLLRDIDLTYSEAKAESPTLGSVMINNVNVPISGSLTLISDALYLNSSDAFGELIMYSPSGYLYISAEDDWNKVGIKAAEDSVDYTGVLSANIAPYLQYLDAQPIATERSIYIWTSSAPTADATTKLDNKYKITFTNIVKPGISGATISTTTNAMFTSPICSTPVSDVLNGGDAGYFSYNYASDTSTGTGKVDNPKKLNMGVTPTGKTYSNAQVSFSGSSGTTFSLIDTTWTTVGITSAGLLTIPAAVLNSAGTDDIVINVLASSTQSKYQPASTTAEYIKLTVQRYSTATITSANAVFAKGSSINGYYTIQSGSGARAYAQPTKTSGSELVIQVATTSTSYSNITLSFAESGASAYTLTAQGSNTVLSSSGSGDLSIPATLLNDPLFKDASGATIKFTVNYNVGTTPKTYTIEVKK